MRIRQWVDLWLSPLALSNTALAWASAIGGIGSLLLVPGPDGAGYLTWRWCVVIAAAQIAFALILLAFRRSLVNPRPGMVLLALAVGGALRGIIIEIGAEELTLNDVSVAAVTGRALNSAVISIIGVALIGATLAWRADFRAEYQILRDRAMLLGAATQDGDAVDPAVLAAWTDMKSDLDVTLRRAGDRLESGSSPQDLQSAAQLLTDAIDLNLRPAARAMWLETVPEEEPIRPSRLLLGTIAQWQLPVLSILAFYLVVVGVGSLVRSGLIDGGAYTVRYLLVTGVVLSASVRLARALPGKAPVIAIITLIALPPTILLCDHWIGSSYFGLPMDPSGQVLVALQTPITTVLIAMAIEAVKERSAVLAALQARIDTEVALLLQQEGRSTRDAQRLSLFVHHCVQSELAAIAMRANEAASGHDLSEMNEARRQARDRLQQLESLDAHTPPWAKSTDGVERIERVVQAWSGLLDIDVRLPAESECRADQWRLAAQVIEEALANSARHSGARHVTIKGECEREVLLLTLADDGHSDPGPSNPGLGSWWLDRVAPGEWSLERGAEGARLSIRIR